MDEELTINSGDFCATVATVDFHPATEMNSALCILRCLYVH